MVDIYYSLYGSKKPLCLPNAELSAMFKPQKINFGTELKSRPASRPPSQPPSRPSSRPATPLSSVETLETDVQFGIDNFAPLPKTPTPKRALDVIELEDGIIKLEEHEEKIVKDEEIEIYELNNRPTEPIVEPPPAKKPKNEYYSDNSVSLPGISSGSLTGPTGFEGMFMKEEEKAKTDVSAVSKPKKKKKDKKKHRHKHKHKKNREKDKERSMEKKDPNITRILKEENQETLSSADSSSNSNMQTDLSINI